MEFPFKRIRNLDMKKKFDHFVLEELLPDPPDQITNNRCAHLNDSSNGITLTWSDLSVTVKQVKKSFCGTNVITYKKLVNNVSGAVESGGLVAIMGPSGAGKSTILQTLANRLSDEMMVDGEILLNGTKVNQSMCRLSGLMRQEDIFIPELTVNEHLLFMACLKLDRRMSFQEKKSRVSYLIRELGLKHCRNRRIGGSILGTATGISGGERKRLSFATACLPNPPLLFCDEPTTGLDSLNAIRLVSMMASWNATILCTIHQPSPEVLKYFSTIMLLVDGSHVFSGTVDNATEFFTSAGYQMNVDEGPGEFLLSCLAPTPGSEPSSKMAVKRLVHQFALSEYAKAANIIQKLQQLPNKVNADFEKLRDHKPSTWLYKFFCLFYRSLIELFRNPSLQWLKIGQKIIIAIAAGLCYVGAVNNDQAGVQAIQGVLFILVTENTFPAMYSALALLPKELPLLVRELRDGDYHPSAVYLAKLLSYFPWLALDASIFTAIIYWLANLRATTFAFFMTTLITILCMMVSTACGMMFANLFQNYETASVFLIPFDSTVMITSGTFIKLSTLPIMISWVQYISWMRYSYESMSILQWKDVVSIGCSQTTYLPCLSSGREILEYYSFTEDDLYVNITLLVLLFTIFNIVSYIFFQRRIKKNL